MESVFQKKSNKFTILLETENCRSINSVSINYKQIKADREKGKNTKKADTYEYESIVCPRRTQKESTFPW